MEKTIAGIEKAKALTITFLSIVSIGSLNGSDKEADNISSIKKISRGAEQYPYGSSQWLRRALREQLSCLGWELSEGAQASIEKGAATTQQDPQKYIDDDLFGFMGTEKKEGEKGSANKRTSPVRVTPLIAMNKYEGDLDYGTNYMAVKAGGDPNIFETEIHSGIYRGTILIELDRVGCGEGFEKELSGEEKAKRVKALLDALKNLWSTGRQSRFLADISPKFLAAALTKVKNPIFLETLLPEGKGVNVGLLEDTLAAYNDVILAHVFGAYTRLFDPVPRGTKAIGEAFEEMKKWVDGYYQG